MGEPFIGSEAVASGRLTKYVLHSKHVRLFRDVYVARDAVVTAAVSAKAAWLWSGRRGVVAGLSAAAVHGSKYVDADSPVDLIHTNRYPNAGLHVRADNICPGETMVVDGITVTTPERTAVDIACWYPRDIAVAAIDALARFDARTREARVRGKLIKHADVISLAQRSRSRQNIENARKTLDLVDFGAQSPKETWLRLLLIDGGLPRPKTQIGVPIPGSNKFIYLDMGWEEIKVAAEYDGEQHWKKRSQFSWDIKRQEIAQRQRWINIRVQADDERMDILRRTRGAIASGRARV